MTRYMTVTDGEVEPKVKAATGGAIGGVVVAGLVDYLLSVSVFHGGAVPAPVADFVQWLIPVALSGGGAWIAGYLARHVQRSVSASDYGRHSAPVADNSPAPAVPAFPRDAVTAWLDRPHDFSNAERDAKAAVRAYLAQ